MLLLLLLVIFRMVAACCGLCNTIIGKVVAVAVGGERITTAAFSLAAAFSEYNVRKGDKGGDAVRVVIAAVVKGEDEAGLTSVPSLQSQQFVTGVVVIAPC